MYHSLFEGHDDFEDFVELAKEASFAGTTTPKQTFVGYASHVLCVFFNQGVQRAIGFRYCCHKRIPRRLNDLDQLGRGNSALQRECSIAVDIGNGSSPHIHRARAANLYLRYRRPQRELLLLLMQHVSRPL